MCAASESPGSCGSGRALSPPGESRDALEQCGTRPRPLTAVCQLLFSKPLFSPHKLQIISPHGDQIAPHGTTLSRAGGTDRLVASDVVCLPFRAWGPAEKKGMARSCAQHSEFALCGMPFVLGCMEEVDRHLDHARAASGNLLRLASDGCRLRSWRVYWVHLDARSVCFAVATIASSIIFSGQPRT